ncbi:hypothetical protein ACFQBY_18580 [Promicromonospora citrea]|uniref:Uncharacterized protein n=1 Tax=Promicromonospora citrea TaxID=43677 RepID=A0A8H9L2R2_9MICO|nr:hypothetical protein [Promicromonospora citrea]NNH54739.1 hypothetical protein [Promicromonospora citrea]GGM23599.1 hypothetical protein GCM10010102_19160 [Promicromonospora citrea]
MSTPPEQPPAPYEPAGRAADPQQHAAPSPGQQYPAPARPRKTGPKVLTFVGVGVLVLGIVLGVVGGVGTARGIADMVPADLVTAQGTAGSDAIGVEQSTTPLTFEATEPGAYIVYEVSRGPAALLAPSAVTAEGPGGPVHIMPPDQSGALPINGWSVYPLGVIGLEDPGSHTLVVDERMATPDAAIAVGAPLDVDSTLAIGTGGLVLLGGFLLGGLGFALTVAGAIWWAVAKR